MSTACLYLPSFVLQAHAHRAPRLVGTAFAVVDRADPRARLVACSQPALNQGLLSGMTESHARALAPSVRFVDHDPGAVSAAMDDVLTTVTAVEAPAGEPTVQSGGPGTVYVTVPPDAPLTHALFAARLIAALGDEGALGFRCRVGIASNRFVAWAATQARPHKPVRVVPGGAEARFLSPLALDLLPLDESVRHTLASLGVRTLGDFASLPPPSVTRPNALGTSSLQSLARGELDAPQPHPLPSLPRREPPRRRIPPLRRAG
jgi:protein ImuB